MDVDVHRVGAGDLNVRGVLVHVGHGGAKPQGTELTATVGRKVSKSARHGLPTSARDASAMRLSATDRGSWAAKRPRAASVFDHVLAVRSSAHRNPAHPSSPHPGRRHRWAEVRSCRGRRKRRSEKRGAGSEKGRERKCAGGIKGERRRNEGREAGRQRGRRPGGHGDAPAEAGASGRGD